MFSLRDDADLREFVLENVEHFGEERVLGTGSYGSVQEVMINGEVYAAKKIHEVLLETDERGGVANLAGNYRRECRLMARIRHPNITQFIGLCFVTGSRLPLLVMERLDSSLDDLLESTPNIPLSVTQYILVCVARGLLHLHRESVVHRDLTARNVLLTASLRAKITDFGNSRIVNLEPGRLARTLTRFPGTLVYMPPEALSDRGHSVYGPSLDVFSFGVLQLFALTQVFPGDLLAPTYSDPNNPDHLLAHSEFERRGPYTALLERSLAGGREHPLFGLVRECLANTPERRPTTAELLSSLEEVGREMDGGLLQLDIARVKTARTLRAKEKRIEALQREVVQKDRILERKDEQIVQKDEQLTEKDGLLAQKDELLVQKDEEVADKDTQLARQQQILNSVRANAATKDGVIADKDRQLSEQESRIADLISQREGALVERAALLQAHSEQIEHKDAELVRRDAIIQQQRQGLPPRELRPPLTLKWRRGKDMPIKMGGSVQSVVIGDTVYVGGGGAGNDRDSGTVMKTEQDQWTKLPEYTAMYFAMTSLANRLVLVGGSDPRNNKPTNQLAVFEAGEWTHPYLPMNIARNSSTAVSFNNHIIVAGGCDDKGRTSSSVEVLDVASRRWYIAQSLPNPRSDLKSTLIGNTLYT
ncbi:serine/threonine-protein kinase TAO3-like isoform X3 [Halichondria panicea]|uniref:serine/threonine-protein kinase TAO3-like isoform X3 n=1 Tax=Halichondria panicea TaxID=6063 RepID=UPI00312BA0FC